MDPLKATVETGQCVVGGSRSLEIGIGDEPGLNTQAFSSQVARELKEKIGTGIHL